MELNRDEKVRFIRLMEEKLYRDSRNKWMKYFHDTGPHRRELYAKHMEVVGFTNADPDDVTEVAFIAANRLGKTVLGAYCVKCWTTGIYPEWWHGRRFNGPTNGWCSGDTGETVRDILQYELLGPANELGTGMIPADAIIKTTPRTGIPDAVKDVYIRHESGGASHIGFKSYDQKRKSFQGTEKHWILNDEEPPIDVYTEELMRLMTKKGVMLNTFTPLLGLSDVVLSFLPGGKIAV